MSFALLTVKKWSLKIHFVQCIIFCWNYARHSALGDAARNVLHHF